MTDHQVIHVTAETHAAAKAYCRTRGLMMREWASALILEATRATAQVNAVERRPVVVYPTADTDALERPPFYADREKKG